MTFNGNARRFARPCRTLARCCDQREIPFRPWPVANARRGAIVLFCNLQGRQAFEGAASGFQMTAVSGGEGHEAGSPNLKGIRILLVEDFLAAGNGAEKSAAQF